MDGREACEKTRPNRTFGWSPLNVAGLWLDERRCLRFRGAAFVLGRRACSSPPKSTGVPFLIADARAKCIPVRKTDTAVRVGLAYL